MPKLKLLISMQCCWLGGRAASPRHGMGAGPPGDQLDCPGRGRSRSHGRSRSACSGWCNPHCACGQRLCPAAARPSVRRSGWAGPACSRGTACLTGRWKTLCNERSPHRAGKGLLTRPATIVDATIIAAPSSPTSPEHVKGEPDRDKQANKGNRWHFGMTAHIGVDGETGPVTRSSARQPPSMTCPGPALLSGQAASAFGNAGDRGPDGRKTPGGNTRAIGDLAGRPGRALTRNAPAGFPDAPLFKAIDSFKDGDWMLRGG